MAAQDPCGYKWGTATAVQEDGLILKTPPEATAAKPLCLCATGSENSLCLFGFVNKGH